MGTELLGRRLRAGALAATLDGGELRHVTWYGTEVVRRLQVAVRPPDWSTVAPVVTATRIRRTDGAFDVQVRCRHRGNGVDLRWTGTITGAADGVLTFRMDGRAERGFPYARVGLCVLHPPAVAGSPYVARDADGAPESGVLSRLVTPQTVRGGVLRPAVGPFRTLELGPAGASLHLSFDGDDFEMEDQRNWTDASFKTYSRPLAAGPPAPAAAGDRFVQAVRIRMPAPVGPAPAASTPPPHPADAWRTGGRVGSVGVVADHLGGPRSAAGRRLLRDGRLGHVRVEVRPGDTAHALDARVDLVRELGVPVEMALFLPTDGVGVPPAGVLERLAGLPVARVLVLPHAPAPATPAEVTSSDAVAAVRADVAARLPGVPVGGGSDAHFCELNRWRPRPGAFDVVTFPVVAQEHAWDDRSMAETHEVLADVMATCRSFVGDVPVAVGPVTLRRRAPATPPPAGDDPAADPRQHTPFAAAWLLGEVGALLTAGADSVTAFTTCGGRGVLADDGAEPVASPSLVVLGALAARRGERVVRVAGLDPLRTSAFASTDGTVTRLLVGDLSGRPRSLPLPPAVRTVTVLEGGIWAPRPATEDTLRLPAHGLAEVAWRTATDGGRTEGPTHDGGRAEA